ncbi:MAG: hypothetical protein KDK23_12200 [Leptospiraceae bacterium]|nr:hypothetical protein [Leptospiraceae bacterium]
MSSVYRGRLAPSPTGYLHPGHLSTFLTAWRRCRQADGILLYRMEDLDRSRCRPEFDRACLEDLALFLNWDEGPDSDGAMQRSGPYRQSERHERGLYLEYWKRLRDGGFIYPAPYSRSEIQKAARKTGVGPGTHGEQIFPPILRHPTSEALEFEEPGNMAFRFRVPDRSILFDDVRLGRTGFHASRDFGDFLVWSPEGYPSYEFSVVVDDHLMRITEVVRGEDLLLSTARQLLVYEALDWQPPAFYHCALLRSRDGQRLSKRKGSTTLRGLLSAGWTVADLLNSLEEGFSPALLDSISATKRPDSLEL